MHWRIQGKGGGGGGLPLSVMLFFYHICICSDTSLLEILEAIFVVHVVCNNYIFSLYTSDVASTHFFHPETIDVDVNEVIDKFALCGRHKFTAVAFVLFAFIVRQLIVMYMY